MFQINGDRVGRLTAHPMPIGDYMEIKTTFKCTRQNVVIDKLDYKSKHFHDFNIVRTGEHYDPGCAITMIKCKYRAEQKNKQPQQPPHRRRFTLFMMNKQPEEMKKLMIRSACTTYEIRETYDNHNDIGSTQPRHP
eukprot:5498442-Amphidinium_carterae.1